MNEIICKTNDELVLIMDVNVLQVVFLNDLIEELRKVFTVQLEPAEVADVGK